MSPQGRPDPIAAFLDENPAAAAVLGVLFVGGFVWYSWPALGLGIAAGALIGAPWGAAVGTEERWQPHAAYAALAAALVAAAVALFLSVEAPLYAAPAGAAAAAAGAWGGVRWRLQGLAAARRRELGRDMRARQDAEARAFHAERRQRRRAG